MNKIQLSLQFVTSTFRIGTRSYVSAGEPIEALVYFRADNESTGIWRGKSNVAFEGKHTPILAFKTVVEAIGFIESQAQNDLFRGAILKDYLQGILYFDNDELALNYFKGKEDELIFFSQKIRKGWKW